MFIHEMGHIYVAKFLGHKVREISVYPFGFSATIEHFNHIKPLEIFFILIGGIGFHLVFPLFFKILYDYQMISYVYYQYIIEINKSIFLFNLLPVFPLDGGRFLFALLRLFFNYKRSKQLTVFVSLIFIIVLIVYSKVSMKIILLFILYLIYIEIYKRDEDYVDYYYYQMSVSK